MLVGHLCFKLFKTSAGSKSHLKGDEVEEKKTIQSMLKNWETAIISKEKETILSMLDNKERVIIRKEKETILSMQ